jgi:ArsR family transcriptional regulator
MCVDIEKENLDKYFESLQQFGKSIDLDNKIQKLSKILNSLRHETRLRILKALSVKDYCVCELEAILDKPQSSISHHLKSLEDIGLIRGFKKGYFTHYELMKDKFQPIFDFIYEEFSITIDQ